MKSLIKIIKDLFTKRLADNKIISLDSCPIVGGYIDVESCKLDSLKNLPISYDNLNLNKK